MRHLTKIAALAALPALGIGIATAGSANAAGPTPNANPNSAITLTDQTMANNLVAQGQGTITKNIDIPRDSNITLEWTTVNGNVTVEGHLALAHDVVNGNVTVTGTNCGLGSFDGAGLELFNGASHITGNLTVKDSSGYWGGNSYGWSLFDNADGTTQVDGGLTLQNNTGGVYISNGGMHVAGKFTDSGNLKYVWPANIWTIKDGLTVSGKTVTIE
jgi:hypothetical protein